MASNYAKVILGVGVFVAPVTLGIFGVGTVGFFGTVALGVASVAASSLYYLGSEFDEKYRQEDERFLRGNFNAQEQNQHLIQQHHLQHQPQQNGAQLLNPNAWNLERTHTVESVSGR